MVDNSVLKVDDKIYLVIDTIYDNEIKYVYFLNEQNQKEIFNRKDIKENDKNYLIGLDSEEEILKALKLFEEKNK